MIGDIETFVSKYQSLTHPLNGSAQYGLKTLLGFIIADTSLTDRRWISYVLATTRHECAGTWQPVEEYGHGAGHPYGVPVNGHTYYGRGYVQLTWLKNYQNMASKLSLDLVNHPELALVPSNAYSIMAYGMVHGSFTGVNLSTFLNDYTTDYFNARKIINGLDQAQKIADYATLFESLIS